MSESSLNSDRYSQVAARGEWLLFVCAMAMLAASILRAEPLQSANDRSRWATVWSLVERHTFQIDEIDRTQRFSTIDKVRHRTSDDAPYHFYSSKPPLLSTIVAGLYAIERRTLGFGLFAHTHLVVRGLLLIVNLLPMMLAVRSLCNALNRLQVSQSTVLFLLATAGFGSMLNPYLTTLNNHTPAAVCVMFCLSAMIRMQRRSIAGHRQSRTDFLILGLNAAFSSCFELPSALFGVLAFLFAMKKDFKKALAWFVPAALIPLAAFFVTNWMATGGIRPFYTYYGTDKYVYVHDGVPSYWSRPNDLDANQEPWPIYLFHCVLGHHGILSLSPVLLLVLPGWWAGSFTSGNGQPDESDADRRHRTLLPIHRMGMLLTMATLLFYLSRTQNYNYGGNSVALRWMLWLTPFWWISMVPVVERLQQSRAGFRFAIVLLTTSIISANWSQDTPWRPSWLYQAMEQAGWIDYRTPRS